MKKMKRLKRPKKLGSSWKGKKYIHGPRKKSPKKFSEFRLGKPTKDGTRLVFGKDKKTGKWLLQSELTPVKKSKSKTRRKKKGA